MEVLQRTEMRITAENVAILDTVLQFGRPQICIQFCIHFRALLQRVTSKQLQAPALNLELLLLQPVKEQRIERCGMPKRLLPV